MGTPILQPTPAQTAAALTAAATGLTGAGAPLPAPWITLMTGTWTRLVGILSAGTFADHTEDATLALRLARAGTHACMAGAREADAAALYPYLIAGDAHRHAWTSLATGWPNRRPIRTNLPLELANVRSAEARALTTATAERYLALLLSDPLGLTWTTARTALTAIPSGVFTES